MIHIAYHQTLVLVWQQRGGGVINNNRATVYCFLSNPAVVDCFHLHIRWLSAFSLLLSCSLFRAMILWACDLIYLLPVKSLLLQLVVLSSLQGLLPPPVFLRVCFIGTICHFINLFSVPLALCQGVQSSNATYLVGYYMIVFINLYN